MTTAAAVAVNDHPGQKTAVLGGISQAGDVNIASQHGAIVTSTNGLPRLRVNVDGSVTLPANPDSREDHGVLLDAAQKHIVLGNTFEVAVTDTRARLGIMGDASRERHHRHTSASATSLALAFGT